MMKNSPYFKNVQLLLKTLPHISKEKCFALKGGTAINLFFRDMPRLSVDIDLAYLPIEPRDITLKNISEALLRISKSINASMPNCFVHKIYQSNISYLYKLIVQDENCQVLIEPNTIFRGSIFPVVESVISQTVESHFELYVSTSTLSMADLYGSKLCAALDRQHPRDLFDIKILIENEGITPKIQQAFVIYLASHNRPINELLNPNLQDIKKVYANEFVGMVSAPIEYDSLIKTRDQYIKLINTNLTNEERKFLLSIKKGEPEWGLIKINGINKLPGLKWKLENIRKMDKKKHQESYEKLKRILEL